MSRNSLIEACANDQRRSIKATCQNEEIIYMKKEKVSTASDAVYRAPECDNTSATRSWMILVASFDVSVLEQTNTYLSLRIRVSSSASFIRAFNFF